MSGKPINQGALGIVLVLIILKGRNAGSAPLLPPIRFDYVLKDMHRVVDVMDKIDGVTHLSSKGVSIIPDFSDDLTHKSDYHDSSSSPSMPFNMPDLSSLMEMAGPLMSMFKQNN